MNPSFSISLNLTDRVLGLAFSIEFSNWLNLFCLPFIIFLKIKTVNFLPIVLKVLLMGQDFISMTVSEGFIICVMAFLTLADLAISIATINAIFLYSYLCIESKLHA